jgi:hypothetical protein
MPEPAGGRVACVGSRADDVTLAGDFRLSCAVRR